MVRSITTIISRTTIQKLVRKVAGRPGSFRQRTIEGIKSPAKNGLYRTGDLLYSVGAGLVNRFGPEQMIKPRDKDTLLEIVGKAPRIVLFKVDNEGNILFLGESSLEVLGIDPGIVNVAKIPFSVGISDAKLRSQTEKRFKERLKKGGGWGGQVQFNDIEENPHDLRTFFYPILDPKGKPAGAIGIAIDVTEIGRLQKELKELIDAFYSVFKMIPEMENLDDILNEIVYWAKKILPIDACAIKILNPEGNFVVKAKVGLGEQYGSATGKKLEKTLSREAFIKGAMIGTSNIESFKSTADKIYKAGLYSGLQISLPYGGKENLAVMTMYSPNPIAFTKRGKHIFTSKEIEENRDLRLISLFVGLAAVAISNAELATLDGLTNIPVRRVFKERLIFNIKASMRTKNPISILFSDIDKFKAVNDTFGDTPHGDNTIIEFVRILVKNAWPGDLLARYGGDEFVDLLISTDKDGAKIAAERIKKAVSSARITIKEKVHEGEIRKGEEEGLIYIRKNESGEHEIGLATSIGVLTIPSGLFDEIDITKEMVREKIDELALRLTEEAMYLASQANKEAKRKGRNIIVVDEGKGLLGIIKEVLGES